MFGVEVFNNKFHIDLLESGNAPCPVVEQVNIKISEVKSLEVRKVSMLLIVTVSWGNLLDSLKILSATS